MSDGPPTTTPSDEQRLAREREVVELAEASQAIAKGILVALLAGMLLLALSQGWGYWQLPAFIAGGLFIAGLLVGFLFGIPKVASAAADGAQQHPLLTPNTNLEQISDWLTKIIVGLGLVELYKIPSAISQFVGATSPAYHSSSAAAALAVTIYFPILGFTSGFLITRLYLSGLIARADIQLGHASDLWDKGFAKLQNALDKGKQASLSEEEARAVQAREKKLESTPKSTYTAKDWLDRGLAAYAAQDLNLAAECFDAVVRDPEATQKQVAQALLNESAVYYQLTQPEKALAASDAMLSRFGSSTDSDVLQWVALAVYNKGLALMMLGQLAAALDTFNDDLVKRLEGDSNPQVREYAWAALYFRGSALLSLGRYSDALAILDDDLIKHLAASQLPQVRELAPAAAYSRGLTLLYVGRYADALAIFDDDLVKSLEASTRREVRELAPAALYNKGVALLNLGRFDDALAIFNDDLIKRLEAATVPQVHDLAVAAEYNRGLALLDLGRFDDALKIFDDDLVARLEAATSPQERDLAPAAQYNKGMALFNLGRLDDARAIFDDDLIKRLESTTLPQIRALAPLATQMQHDLSSHAPQ
ncbi:MAG TPA: tetratricopeptide repeat protein [Candidatus Binatia bacterium]|nr:tetratricopeptide repeat protein [Candidatus Binatia bacterium]